MKQIILKYLLVVTLTIITTFVQLYMMYGFLHDVPTQKILDVILISFMLCMFAINSYIFSSIIYRK